MQTSLLLLMLGLSARPLSAQTPVPIPARPTPAPRPVAPPRAPAQHPLPLDPFFLHDRLNLLDHMQFELETPLAFHDLTMELPHEPLFPPVGWEPLLPALPDLPALPQMAATPLLPSPMARPAWSDEAPNGRLSRLRPDQNSPEDSLFRAGREALSRGEYARASTLFQSFEQRYPRSRVAPAAMYWRAFSLYRSGASEELRAALAALKAQQDRYPEAASDPDAATLRIRLYAALAARGDAQAATMLRQANSSGTTCDREEMEVRAEALNALAQLNTPDARPTLKRVLARRDECSTILRRRAVYILGRNGTDEGTADLIDVAKSDPDPEVRGDAIMLIARAPGAATVKVLEQLFNESTDQRTREAALAALRAKGGPDARRALRAIIEKSDVPERTRAQAIQELGRRAETEVYVGSQGRAATAVRDASRSTGDDEDAAFLRGLYAKTDSRIIKGSILYTVSRIGGSANDQWLLAIAKNREEDSGLRREALSRIKTTNLSIDELGKLFDALPERELRSAVISQLASRDDSAAVDKLIEIAKSGTDPQIRRQAIAALARKNDPRTTKLLLELVEKP
jgi:HEAT repeat protein